MHRDARGNHVIPDPLPEGWPDCMCCGDSGIVGGDKHGHEYRFCLCPAGGRRREQEPNVVAESNAVRDKLLLLSSR